MKRWVMAALLSGAAWLPQPAAAFWQRSQVSMCSDATTEAERLRLRCWELDAYVDPGWPALGIGSVGAHGWGAYERLERSRRPVHKGVTRRLG